MIGELALHLRCEAARAGARALLSKKVSARSPPCCKRKEGP
jgi:hypothetical protein